MSPAKAGRRAAIPSSAPKVIVFAVITVVLLGILATLIGNISFTSDRTFKATFTDATNVLSGNRVRLAGVEVGTVDSVELVDVADGRQYATVTFSVREEVPVSRDAQLELRLENIVGQRYLAIETEPGDQQMPAGETFPVEQTTPALNLTQLFNGFQPLLRALDPERTNELSFQVVRAFQGEADTFAALLRDTASLTNGLADRDQVIGELVDNMNVVLQTLSVRDQELTDLIIRFRDLMVGLSGDRERLAGSLPDLVQLLEQTTVFVEDIRSPFKRTVQGLAEVARALRVDRRELARSLRSLPDKMRFQARSGSYGSWFNFFVCGAEVRLKLLNDTVYLSTPAVAANDAGSVCTEAGNPGEER